MDKVTIENIIGPSENKKNKIFFERFVSIRKSVYVIGNIFEIKDTTDTVSSASNLDMHAPRN
jgi:hypothetical protein